MFYKNFYKIPSKTPVSVFLFQKKETLAQVFSNEFSEILKTIFFTEHLRESAFDA